jgi:decaprenyl-phosphate phosphoribosyltransferase
VIRALVKEARPKQWLKNLLVFAAPAAAGVLDDPKELGLTIVAFVGFCLAASGTYYWNDVLDVEADRAHPTKRHRPIASGAISIGVARVVGTLALVGGVGIGFVANPKTALTLAVYVALTLTYSSIWKHIAVLDLVAIAGGFVLRAIGGAFAAEVDMSTWFILVVTFGSLFIVTGKRYAELREMGEAAATTRATLEDYTLTYLQTVLAISCGAALVAYCLWAFETRELAETTFPWYELSIVPMLAALLRYLLVLEQGHGGAPEEIFVSDRVIQLLGLTWAVTFGLGVYAG